MKQILLSLILLFTIFSEASTNEWNRKNSCSYASSGLVDRLLDRMTLEQKVGQILQPDLDFVSFEDIKKYQLGSVLNGGNTAPFRNNDATPDDWKKYAKELFNNSPIVDGIVIPVLWGTDAVHGHSNIKGATLFPHNIGLGATHNPDLLREIGKAVALEVMSTGVVWTFAPTIAVPQNDSWGRTYEGFSEDPMLVSSLGKAMIEGLQGTGDDFLGANHILATAKHFLGDGGTLNGVDRGNTILDEDSLRAIHGKPYFDALDACVQVVMASFNSWNGTKMHSSKYMLSEILKGQMQFDGFVVGDWNGHGEIPGCTNDNCPEAFNAGVDMYMVPENWKALRANILDQVKSGTISMQRLDEAVTRILTAKERIGLLDGRRPHEFNQNFLKSEKHLSLAKQAVRESLVLLKNNNQTLPIKPKQRIGVIGKAANLVRFQTGGWTITWQGTENKNSDFIDEISILEALKKGAAEMGHEIIYSESGNFEAEVDFIIAVYGEEPYAEMLGDIDTISFKANDLEVLPALEKAQQNNISTLSIFLSGRPMELNAFLNASDAFIAAWLPGTGVMGIAEVLFKPQQYDFTGKLSFSWPKHPSQTLLNIGDDNYDPLFPYGYGLTYKDDIELAKLEVSEASTSSEYSLFLGVGRNGFSEFFVDANARTMLESDDYQSSQSNFSIARFQYIYQDDSKRVSFSSPKNIYGIGADSGINITNWQEGSLKIIAKANTMKPASLLISSNYKNWGKGKNLKVDDQWREYYLPLSCVSDNNVLKEIYFKANNPLVLEINSIALSKQPAKVSC